jgi:hypothetical protein
MEMNHLKVSLQRPAHSTPESLDNHLLHNVSTTTGYFSSSSSSSFGATFPSGPGPPHSRGL